MQEMGKKQENRRLYNDSQSPIHLAKNSSFHSNTKHIQLKYHFIRSVLDEELLKLEKIHVRVNLDLRLSQSWFSYSTWFGHMVCCSPWYCPMVLHVIKPL